MQGLTLYTTVIGGVAFSLLVTTAAIGYFLDLFPLLREMSEKAKRRRAAKPQPGEIELETFGDVQRRAKERRREEERLRWKRNELRKEQGFYQDLGKAYRRSGGEGQ